MPKKLHYFNLNAIAEPIRYILHYTKQDFEDIRHDINSWPDPKVKAKCTGVLDVLAAASAHHVATIVLYVELNTDQNDTKHDIGLPYGQFPLYEEDGRVLTQSMAIAKYVARGTDLIPADPWQQAIVESAVYTILDYWKNGTTYFSEKDPVKKEELKKKLLEETIDYYFSRFSKQLSENGGYFNGKLSWGEFVLTGILEATNLLLGTELEKKYPVVGATVENIRNLPGVKEYIAAREPYTLPKSFEKK